MKNIKQKKFIILGSEGQIGKPLCSFLKNKGHKIYNVDLLLGKTHDLRNPDKIIEHWMSNVDFVFFLAYDIGGAKFLETEQDTFKFLDNNTSIMLNTFRLLEKYKKPFIFASSSMANMPWSSYGILKKLGESFTKSLGGINIRLWNVYGPEKYENKSHVITDFIHKAKTTKTISMLTDGNEERQFLHVNDCSNILYTLSNNFHKASKNKIFDVSTGKWTKIITVANIVAKHYDASVITKNYKDCVQKNSRFEPNLESINEFWDHKNAISVYNGIASMIEYYEQQENQNEK